MSAQLQSFLSFDPQKASINCVQIDSLVIMKIVKHIDIEHSTGITDLAGETCQGILTGLISSDDKRLEVTNCFPSARSEVLLENEENTGAAITQDDKQNEVGDMLKRFRNMNIDYELVGFYQSHMYGACFNQDIMESLVEYQINNPDAVVLIYDPIKTRQGILTFKAYRLSAKALEIGFNSDWSLETIKQSGIVFDNLVEELPIILKSSHLMNVLLSELRLSSDKHKKEAPQLELGTRRALEKSMRSLMSTVDELNKALSTYNKYIQEKQKYDMTYNTLLQKRQTENELRQAKGETPLPLDDIKKNMTLKQPQLVLKNGLLDLFMSALETRSLSGYQSSAANENISKLFLSKTVATIPNSTTRNNS